MLTILFLFLILPVGVIISKAFLGPEGFTLEYFSLLADSAIYRTAIINSLGLGVVVTLLSTLMAAPLALLNARFQFPGKSLLAAMLLLPLVMPPFVGAIGVQRFFARYGSVNLLLMDAGWIDTPIDWLGPDHAFVAVAVLEALHLFPIIFLNLTAAMANIDPSMEEMADTLGVSRWRRYVDIIWPLARPGYFAGAIIVFIWAVTDLGTPLLVGYHDTLPVRIFNMVSDVNENPVGYALVFCVILMTVGMFLVSRLTTRGNRFAMLARGHVSPAMAPLPRAAMLPVYAGFLLVIFLAVLPHLSVVITSISHQWFMTPLPRALTAEHFGAALGQTLSATGIRNSLMLAAAATLFDVVLGLLVAFIVVRRLIPFAGLLDAICMIPLALPGIVLAFGYVVTWTGTALDPMVNPTILLIAAYGIRRLPFMIRSASAGLQQTSVALEEASHTFGAGRLHTLLRISLPLLTANLIAGGLMCFSWAMLDVSDSLILAMKERFYPMTKAIYALFLEQGSGGLVACALGVIGMIILGSCMLGASLLLGKKAGELFRA